MPNEIGSEQPEKHQEEAKNKMKEVFEKKGVELGTDEFDVEKVSTQISDFDEKVVDLLKKGSGENADSLKGKINSTPWLKQAYEKKESSDKAKGLEMKTTLDKQTVAQILVAGVWQYEFNVPFLVKDPHLKYEVSNPTRVNDLYAKTQKECKTMAEFNSRFLTKMNFLQAAIA